MCILCVSRSSAGRGVRQVLSTWQASPCSLSGVRAFSSLPEPVHEAVGHANAKDGKVAHPSLLNENLLKAQYAVRGELYNKALELQKAGRELIFTNVRKWAVSAAAVVVVGGFAAAAAQFKGLHLCVSVSCA